MAPSNRIYSNEERHVFSFIIGFFDGGKLIQKNMEDLGK